VPSQPDVFGRATPLKIDWRLVRTIESTREPGVRSDVDNGFKLTLFELKFDEDYVLFVRAYEPENYPLGVTCEWACKHIRLEHRTEGHERIQQLSPTMMSRQTSRATGSKETWLIRCFVVELQTLVTSFARTLSCFLCPILQRVRDSDV
jgi:hypothetical protein